MQCRIHLLAVAVLIAVLIACLAGCGAPGPLIPEQQSARTSSTSRPPPAPEAVRVSRGDTLYSLAFRYGLDWRDVARWNGIGAPYTIHVGDWIRLQPQPDMRPAVIVSNTSPSGPEARSGSAAEQGRGARAEPESRPGSGPQPEARAASMDDDLAGGDSTDGDSTTGDASGTGGSEEKPAEPGPDPEPAPKPAMRQERAIEPDEPPSGPARSVAGVSWRWPTRGRVTREFDNGASRKGILIAGEDGQPVRAAASGEVVYSGNGLIGYGELIIVKHSDSMLSAYAHNRERLVVEGDRVQSGALIARMGSNEREETVLHFEIRRDGKPTDPAAYLPRR